MKIAQQLDNIEPKLGGQFDVIMCAATLVANGLFKLDDTMQATSRYWIQELEEDCQNCPCFDRCIVCIREE